MLRVRRVGMVLLLLAGTCLGAVYSVRAEFERSLLSRSVSLFELARHWVRAQPRTLVLNGARIVLTTGRSEQPIGVLLDHFQAACRRHSGGVHAALQQVPARGHALPSLMDGVLRAEHGGQGMVACLDLGEATLGPEEWLRRIERFAATSDLAQLGGLRVVRAQALGDGSFFVAAWNDGSLQLRRMFPKVGDAPGTDFPALPRPQGSRRIFSAWQEQAPSGVNVYASAEKAGPAFEAHMRALEALGWSANDGSFLRSEKSSYAALYQRQGSSVVVQAQPDGAGSLISVLPMDLPAP
jgi:hypothetical protein